MKTLEDPVPALKYEIVEDTLYITPTGDPTFLHREFESSKILNFLKNHPGILSLFYPESSEKPFGPGWAWEDYNYGYSAERSPFPLFGNTVEINFSPEGLDKIDPSSFRSMIQVDSTDNLKRTQRDFKKNTFNIPLFGTSAFRQNIPFITSAELSAQLLSDTLNKKVHLLRKLPKHVKLQQKLYSQPVDTLYKRMLHDSDNFFAEQLLLIAAGEISDTLDSEIVINHIKEEYFKDLPDDIKWVDGSGLSRYNLATPRSLVWILEKIYEEVPQERLFRLLPAGGASGTLKNDYSAPPGNPPFVFAKTGTLSNNHNLSGYLVTASGKILIFSFMNNHYMTPTAVVKTKIDQVLRELYLNY